MNADSALFDTYQDRDRLEALMEKIKLLEVEFSEQEISEVKQLKACRAECSYFEKALAYWRTKLVRQTTADQKAAQKAALEQQIRTISAQLQAVQLNPLVETVIKACEVVSIAQICSTSVGQWLVGSFILAVGFRSVEILLFSCCLFLLSIVAWLVGVILTWWTLESPAAIKRKRLELKRVDLDFKLNTIKDQLLFEPVPTDPVLDKILESLKTGDPVAALEGKIRERAAFIERVVGSDFDFVSIKEMKLSRLIRESVSEQRMAVRKRRRTS